MRTVTLAAFALLVSSPAWSQADGDAGTPVADAPVGEAPAAGDAAEAGDGSGEFVFDDDTTFDAPPSADAIPAYRPEVVVVPGRVDTADGLANLAYGGEGAGFEGAVRAGHEAYEGVPGGFAFGAYAVRLGAATADEDGSGARERVLWAATTVDLVVAADVGLDALHVEVAPYGRRDERSTNDVRSVLWAPLSVSRLRVHGRQLDAAASVARLGGAWRVDAQRGAVAIDAAALGPGLRFIDYTDDHTFFGARLFAAAAELVPEFPLERVTLHYVAGGHVDFAAGARDGGLFVSHNDFDVHTGAGATFAERLHLRSTLGYRAARDTRRDTVAGWVVRTDITVRFP